VPIIGEHDPAARRTSSYPGQRGGRRYRPKSRDRSALKQWFSWQVSISASGATPHHCLSPPPMVRVQRVLPPRCDAEHSDAARPYDQPGGVAVARGPNNRPCAHRPASCRRENAVPQPARHKDRRQAIDRRGSSLAVIEECPVRLTRRPSLAARGADGPATPGAYSSREQAARRVLAALGARSSGGSV
jgi:hypothetical protein